jgi:hypothetical protein
MARWLPELAEAERFPQCCRPQDEDLHANCLILKTGLRKRTADGAVAKQLRIADGIRAEQAEVCLR